MNDRHQRTYGYIGENEGKTIREEKQPLEHEKEEPRRKNQEKKATGRPKIWIRLVVFPFKTLWWLVCLFFRILTGIWQRRPRLPKETRRSAIQTLFRIGVIGVGLGLLFTVGFVAWASKDLPDPDRLLDREVAQSTKLYDRTGEHLLYEIFQGEKRTLVPLETIPRDLINGTVATEDKIFYEHYGVRPLSILRAVAYGVFTKRQISGTSTLTQQLVKNAILTDERSLLRKAKEIILAIRLEQRYTKDQILQIYFNEIPYGSTNYGAQSAAQSYFDKDVSALTLAESAALAGMPKQPTKYLNDPAAFKERRNFVLRRMFEEGHITEQQKNNAQAEPLELKQKVTNITAPHFVLYVKEQLVDQYGEGRVEKGGLKVITSLDWEKQEAAEKVIEEVGTQRLKDAEANNTALLALDPKTGQILAMVGSKDFYSEEIDGQFNVATLGKRQPGSSFKPIIYTAAFEKGYTPETVLFDVVTNFAVSGKPYTPLNYNLKELGPVSMRQALQGSLNIPAVQTLYLVGDKKGVEFAERLGYSTLKNGDFGLSLVLGGGEVKLIDHVAAYGVFANGGKKVVPISILNVEEPDGNMLFEWKPERLERVLDEKYAALISNVLSDDAARAYVFGAGGILTLPGRPVAVKTGTTNNYVDAWTVGYTPSLAAGVWVGNTNNTPMKQGIDSSRAAAPIWNAFMKEALKDTPAESFPAPPPNDAKKPVLRGSTGGNITLLVDKVTGKLATSSTPERYIVERNFLQPHSILHYVNKDDPRGSAPEDPSTDPQYHTWEAAIEEWIKKKQLANPTWEVSFEEPPSEFDDLHSLELIPQLDVFFPTPNAIFTSRQIRTDIRVSAPRGIARVIYRVDKSNVGVETKHPFNLDTYVQSLEPGTHTLTIIVEDDVGNKLDTEIPFTLDAPIEPASVRWSQGDNILSQNDFPQALSLIPFKVEEIKEVRVYAKKTDTDVSTPLATITDFSNLFNNKITISWGSAPEAGRWVLIAEMVTTDGRTTTADEKHIVIE